MPYRIIIHAEGRIEDNKVKTETADKIVTEIKKLSSNADVSVSFRKMPGSESA